jgi:hypothetical protein
MTVRTLYVLYAVMGVRLWGARSLELRTLDTILFALAGYTDDKLSAAMSNVVHAYKQMFLV